ncbi:hypothetical protein K1T71_014847 [Dendrolimus kikuchii]|nr:hypothetical protein K1T71_014847 [Dendrolimus kikuchii]
MCTDQCRNEDEDEEGAQANNRDRRRFTHSAVCQIERRSPWHAVALPQYATNYYGYTNSVRHGIPPREPVARLLMPCIFIEHQSKNNNFYMEELLRIEMIATWI